MILKRSLIPAQDDRENGRWIGVLRPDANTHGERRKSDASTNSRVSEGQPDDRIGRSESGRLVRVGATGGCGGRARHHGRDGAGSARVRDTGQDGAGSDTTVPEQINQPEPAANDAADPPVPAGGRGGSGRL